MPEETSQISEYNMSGSRVVSSSTVSDLAKSGLKAFRTPKEASAMASLRLGETMKGVSEMLGTGRWSQ